MSLLLEWDQMPIASMSVLCFVDFWLDFSKSNILHTECSILDTSTIIIIITAPTICWEEHLGATHRLLLEVDNNKRTKF